MTAEAPEAVASSSGQQVPAEVAQAETCFNFAARLSTLPSLTALCDVATKSYARAKNSYAFVAVPLQLAELGVQSVGKRARPVLDKMSPQLCYIDGLACRGLDKLEAAYPDVTKKQAQEIFNDAIVYGRSKLVSVTVYGVAKAREAKTVAAGAFHVATHPVQTISTGSHRAFNYTIKTLEALDAALDKHMASRAIDMPERPTTSAPNITALLTLLDGVFFKAAACAKAQASASVSAFHQRIGKTRFFSVGCEHPSQDMSLRKLLLISGSVFRTVVLDVPFDVLRAFASSLESRGWLRFSRLVPVPRQECPTQDPSEPTDVSSADSVATEDVTAS